MGPPEALICDTRAVSLQLRGVGLLLLSLFCSTAVAAPEHTLRMVATAPEGSPWARDLRAFAQQVEAATEGHVRIKWYFGAVAGDELEETTRMQRGQLDGHIATLGCDRDSPSIRVTRLAGVFTDLDEVTAVVNRLRPTLESEAHDHGMVLLATSPIGHDIFFTRAQVHSLAELRQQRFWMWDLDQTGVAMARALGLRAVPLPITDAAHAYDGGKIDGFVGTPISALAFQWGVAARYAIDLPFNYAWACLILREDSFMQLPFAYQAAVREAGATLALRNAETARRVEATLLGASASAQGLRVQPPPEAMRAELLAAAGAANVDVAAQWLPPKLLAQVRRYVDEYRAARRATRK
jgi:TRAP-type C4-dicarboxylate transport system substrate-binding protein